MSETYKGREQKQYKRNAAIIATIVGGLAVVGLLKYGLPELAKPKKQTTEQEAEVVKIVPEEIECRARVSALITAAASQSLKIKGDGLPVVGTMLRGIERTNRNTAEFRGINGNGGGQIDTLTCIKTAGVENIVGPNGTQTIMIPTSDVVFESRIVENESAVVHNDGSMASVGQTAWQLSGGVTGSVSEKIAVSRADLDQVARENAVNIAQTACGKAAWLQTEQAITDAYRSIGQHQFEHAKSMGNNKRLTFNPMDVTVIFVGDEPQFTGPYELPHGYTFHNTMTGNNTPTCTVRSDAYQQPNYLPLQAAHQGN
ncbi:MAG: hypothetical protein NVSMB46_01870 [Candidatus Saccharimonadales bacterium]